MSKKSNTKEFIEKAIAVHGSEFDYSLVEYENAITKIKIKCKSHHTFEQTPNNHLRGNGCPHCLNERIGVWNSKDMCYFLEKSRSVHGEKFDYSESVYIKENVPLKIKCNNGHVFMQTPNAHYAGKGCKFCNRLPLLDKQQFITEASKIHAVKFDYSKVIYKDRNTPVEISCPLGHTFMQEPRTHLKGHGCGYCAGRLGFTIKDFIRKSQEKHGEKYSYSLVDFKDTQTKVNIFCKACNSVFSQQAASHMSGVGCPSCAVSGYKPNLSGSIYVISSGIVTKVGITNRDVIKRVKDINRDSGKKFEIIFSKMFEDGSIPRKIEKWVIEYLKTLHKQPAEIFDGYTECFFDVDVGALLREIESMYNNIEGY